jgi:hypothetical protein
MGTLYLERHIAKIEQLRGLHRHYARHTRLAGISPRDMTTAPNQVGAGDLLDVCVIALQ